MNADGTPGTDAMPPFLLRFSPAFFAREAPEVFVYDDSTNRLSLRAGAREPWLRPPHARHGEDRNTWYYCLDCQERWFPSPGQRFHSHVPFRDRASQHYMKPVIRKGMPVDTPMASEPEVEPEMEPGMEPETDCPAPDDDMEDGFPPLSLPSEPPEVRPSLEEYQQRWQEKLAYHARQAPGAFSRDNLCAVVEPQLWQDCPMVPFDELRSAESQARLSVCRPHCSLEEASCADGVPRYAHITGSVNFRRRAMLQLSSLMGFVLNQKSGKLC